MHRRRRHSRALLIARPFFSPGFGLRAVGCLSSRACFFVIQAATAAGSHLFPSRTEQLSPRAPMVLRHSGRVGRRRFPNPPRSLKRSRGDFFCFGRPAPGRGGRRCAAIPESMIWKLRVNNYSVHFDADACGLFPLEVVAQQQGGVDAFALEDGIHIGALAA